MTLSEKRKAIIRKLSRTQMIVRVVKSFDDQITEATEFLDAANAWMSFPKNANERPIDLESLRVDVANLRRKRNRFIEMNASGGPNDPILSPE